MVLCLGNDKWPTMPKVCKCVCVGGGHVHVCTVLKRSLKCKAT